MQRMKARPRVVATTVALIVSLATFGATSAFSQTVSDESLDAELVFAATPDLDPTTIPKYVQPLVIPPVMSGAGPNDYDIAVREFQQQILPGGHWNAVSPACQADPTLCTFPATTVWSYGPASDPLPDSSGIAGGAPGLAPALNSQFNYPAFTVENEVDVPTNVDWINDLKDPLTGRFLPHLLPVDQTLHWANPNADCISGVARTDCRGTSGQPYSGPVPIVTHVHGAHVDPESDGYPEAWWLPACNQASGYAYASCYASPSVGSLSMGLERSAGPSENEHQESPKRDRPGVWAWASPIK